MKADVHTGLYTVLEAATYARLHHVTAGRWLDATRKPRELSPLDNTELSVSFLDFVQLLAVRELKSRGVALERIRQAVQTATDDYKLDYPLAHPDHRVFTDGADVHLLIGGEKTSVQLSGEHRRQRNLPHIEMLYLRDLSFDAAQKPTEYAAFKHGDIIILQRPGIAFGAPTVKDTPYTAIALADAFKAEGTLEAVADAYDVNVEQVEAACHYIDHLDRSHQTQAA